MTDHYDPLGRDDHHGDPADPGPDEGLEAHPIGYPEGTAEHALQTMQVAIDVGTVRGPAQILQWLADRGYEITGTADTLPAATAEAVEALADRLPFDEHLNRMARATELLGQLAIDGWHLERDRTEADVAVEAHPGWQEREDRREAMGLALELVKAGSIGVDDLLVRSQLIQAYLSGRVELVVPAVPIVMLTEAVEALERYAQEKARSTSFHENGAQLLLLGEGLAHVLKALVDHLQDDES